jgi:hypothetical protein
MRQYYIVGLGCDGGDVPRDVTPCNLVKRYRCLGGMCCRDFQGRRAIILPKHAASTLLQKVSYYHILKMQAAGCSGMLGPIYRTIWLKAHQGNWLPQRKRNIHQPLTSPEFALLHSVACVQLRLITVLGNCGCVLVASFLGMPRPTASNP